MNVSIEVKSDDLTEWVRFCTYYNDLFSRAYCGYWMAGVVHSDEGWLCFEEGGESYYGNDPFLEQAEALYERPGADLPIGWMRLDEAAAKRAFAEGVKRWGAGWFSDGRTDACRYDVVVQVALLGEVRYG